VRSFSRSLAAIAAVSLLATACADAGSSDGAAPDPAGPDAASGDGITVGLILVGPRDDRGWSQAHQDGATWVAEQTGSKLIVIDLVNPADSPELTVESVVDDMVAQGADLVIATSDDMKDGILQAAAAHPDVPMIWSSGDSAWTDGDDYRSDLTNLGNAMGRMELGKWIAGCAAGLQTETGSIGYLGPLINDETRRLSSSAYLGAKHCWESRGNDAADLSFSVTWIGFWFNIPGVTLDPTQVANEFFDQGADVVISGIDTTEATTVAGQRAAAGDDVWSVAYDFEGGCDEAPDRCLGVPFFSWGPTYLAIVESVSAGTFEAGFDWFGPDFDSLTDATATGIGWIDGDGLTSENADALQGFIGELADGSVVPFSGPLRFQDGSTFLADGETATDQQVWYLPQLMEGMKGASESS
jgi:simple sugar transport system substrate-binding protein